MKFFKILMALSLTILFVDNSFSATGCTYGGYIYTTQLPNANIYRNPYYSQEYENWTNPSINTSEIAWYKDPNKCSMYDYAPVDLQNTVARGNGCLINGNTAKIGRVVDYSISNYCNLPLDDYAFPLLLVAGGAGFFYLSKSYRV